MSNNDFKFEGFGLLNGVFLFRMSRNGKEQTMEVKIVEGQLQKDVQALKAFTQLWEDTKGE